MADESSFDEGVEDVAVDGVGFAVEEDGGESFELEATEGLGDGVFDGGGAEAWVGEFLGGERSDLGDDEEFWCEAEFAEGSAEDFFGGSVGGGRIDCIDSPVDGGAEDVEDE